MMEEVGPRRNWMKLIRLRRADRLLETPVMLAGKGMRAGRRCRRERRRCPGEAEAGR
jgi:hypothetical protein